MDTKTLWPFITTLSHHLFLTGVSLVFCSISLADQVIITPDKTVSPTFHTSDATCIGSKANTHINLGFGTSVTGEDGVTRSNCTVGGGYDNVASGISAVVGGGYNNEASNSYSTVGGGSSNVASGYSSTVGGGVNNVARGYHTIVGGGLNNEASNYYSTVGGGRNNQAGGEYSWAGGRYMQLQDTADNTFVWGYSDSAQSISTSDAFLIFPAGTSGKVGIGTDSPNEPLEIAGTGRAFFGDGGGSNRKGLLIDGIQGSNAARIESFDYGAFTGMDLVINASGGGKVGINTTDPQYKLDVIGAIRATGSIYYGGTDGTPGDGTYTKADYVFEDGYEILSTEQVAEHLKKENSLPWMTSLKKEKEENGKMIDMTRMSFETVETVENLQLQIISLSDTIKEQQKMIENQSKLNKTLVAENNELKNDIRKIKEALGIL